MVEHRSRKAEAANSSVASGSIFAEIAQVAEHTVGIREVESSTDSLGSISRGWPIALGTCLPNRLAGLDSRTPLQFSGVSC